MSNERKIEFLYASISDAQELIRFIDTKTAIAISIIGALIVGFFTTFQDYVTLFENYSLLLHFLSGCACLLLIICIWISTRIIKPTNNPAENINLDSDRKTSMKFYLAKNKYGRCPSFYNSGKHKLDEKFTEFLEKINKADNIDIIETLSIELFKISFIRNIKNDRFNALLLFLVLFAITFLIYYLLFVHQTDLIKEKLSTNQYK